MSNGRQKWLHTYYLWYTLTTPTPTPTPTPFNLLYYVIFLSTGKYIVVRTESNNTISIFTQGSIKNVNNFCNIPKDVFQSGRGYTGENKSVIKYFTFCKEKNRKWMGKMAVDHINQDRGDNRKVNLRLVWLD
jgi:hypothetical protein